MNTLSRSFVLSLFLAAASQAEAADPQNPQDILARAKAASGGAAWDAVRTIHSKVRVETGGMTGTAESWEDVRAGRFVDAYRFGQMTGAEGYDGTKKWSQDTSGAVTLSDSGDDREGSVNEAYRRSFSYWYPDRRQATVVNEGERREGELTFHVLRITPEGGRPFEMWIDTATFLMDRMIEKAAKETRSTSFSDYREVGGLKLPFRLHVTNGEAQFDQIVIYEVFKRFVVRIDYAERRLTLTLPQAFTAPAGATAVPFTFDEMTPQVDGKLDGIAGRFTIDTGSRLSLSVNRPFAEKHGLFDKPGRKIEALAGWGVGGGGRGLVTRAGLLELGGVRVPAPVASIALQQRGALADPYLAGNVGGGILRRFTVTFDYGRQKIYFEPNASYAQEDVWDRSGLWLNRADEGYRVEDVVADSPAAAAGLKVGDLVLTVNGRKATELPLAEAREILKSAPGTRVRLQVKSDEAAREVAVVLREMV